jgi:hypothetical protein
MNDDQRTPLQRLDDAIAAFLDEVDDDGGTLAGWVLAYQKTKIQELGPEIDPISWGTDYAISAGISPATALGLVAIAERTIRRHATEEADE